MSLVYRMFHGMDSAATGPQAVLVFNEDGICRWVSDESRFATLTRDHLFSLPVEGINSAMKSHVFVPVKPDDPAYRDSIEAANSVAYPWSSAVGVAEAAADFLRAVWEFSTNATALPPAFLASYLERHPHRLAGDDMLPEHLRAAGDALEGLPGAVMGWAAPVNYDGRVEAFLADAERIFQSVSRRLRRLGRDSPSSE